VQSCIPFARHNNNNNNTLPIRHAELDATNSVEQTNRIELKTESNNRIERNEIESNRIEQTNKTKTESNRIELQVERSTSRTGIKVRNQSKQARHSVVGSFRKGENTGDQVTSLLTVLGQQRAPSLQ
jgi:hypothetical protein